MMEFPNLMARDGLKQASYLLSFGAAWGGGKWGAITDNSLFDLLCARHSTGYPLKDVISPTLRANLHGGGGAPYSHKEVRF